jgi:hypothetical protein
MFLKELCMGKRSSLTMRWDLPEGQEVTVTLHPTDRAVGSTPGEGLRRAFGSWAEDADQLDEFLAQTRRDRQNDRQVPSE